MYECAWCGQTWSNRYSAATCCDEISNALHDDRTDKPRYELGYD